MTDYPANSKSGAQQRQNNKSDEKNEKAEVKKVISSEVKLRKKPLSRRFSETFLRGSFNSAISHVFTDILLPAAQDTISDSVREGVDRMIFGESRVSRSRSSRYDGGRTNYQRYADTSRRRDPSTRPPTGDREPRSVRGLRDVPEFVFDTRVEADEVLDVLYSELSQYDHTTLATLYSASGVDPEYTHQRWGWYDLSGSRVRRTGDGGYALELPKPKPIE